jgi:hypothetical protein
MMMPKTIKAIPTKLVFVRGLVFLVPLWLLVVVEVVVLALLLSLLVRMTRVAKAITVITTNKTRISIGPIFIVYPALISRLGNGIFRRIVEKKVIDIRKACYKWIIPVYWLFFNSTVSVFVL